MGGKIGASKLKALEQVATSFQADFRFSPLNIMVLMALCRTGLGLHFCVFPFDLQAVVTIMAVALGLGALGGMTAFERIMGTHKEPTDGGAHAQ